MSSLVQKRIEALQNLSNFSKEREIDRQIDREREERGEKKKREREREREREWGERKREQRETDIQTDKYYTNNYFYKIGNSIELYGSKTDRDPPESAKLQRRQKTRLRPQQVVRLRMRDPPRGLLLPCGLWHQADPDPQESGLAVQREGFRGGFG